jgi:hypothetical protein
MYWELVFEVLVYKLSVLCMWWFKCILCMWIVLAWIVFQTAPQKMVWHHVGPMIRPQRLTNYMVPKNVTQSGHWIIDCRGNCIIMLECVWITSLCWDDTMQFPYAQWCVTHTVTYQVVFGHLSTEILVAECHPDQGISSEYLHMPNRLHCSNYLHCVSSILTY